LEIYQCKIGNALALKNTIVAGEAAMDGCSFKCAGALAIDRFIVSRFRITPASSLFANRRTTLGNPKFWLLERQQNRRGGLQRLFNGRMLALFSNFLSTRWSASTKSKLESTKIEQRELEKLAEEYLSFKHWFSESGDLYMEDVDYYNLRHYRETSITKYLLFNICFGWGVRLWNTLWTTLAVILFYFGIFIAWLGIEPARAIVLRTYP
jgi:hypothetical protein